MDARIGQLMRNGTPLYYAYPQGFNAPPVEGTLAQVEAALEMAIPSAQRKTAPAKRPLRCYRVTVSPSITVYSGAHTGDEYTLIVWANSRNEAIRQAREQRRENEGRYAVKATFRARLSVEDER